LDRHGGLLRPRTLRRDPQPRPRRRLRTALGLNQMLDDLGRERPQPRGGVREIARTGCGSTHRHHRSVPEPLAKPDEEIEEGWSAKPG
jgi:hypothetical protein